MSGATVSMLVDGEPLALANQCTSCQKPIFFFPGRCYRCATGRTPTVHQAPRIPCLKTRFVDKKLRRAASDAHS